MGKLNVSKDFLSSTYIGATFNYGAVSPGYFRRLLRARNKCNAKLWNGSCLRFRIRAAHLQSLWISFSLWLDDSLRGKNSKEKNGPPTKKREPREKGKLFRDSKKSRHCVYIFSSWQRRVFLNGLLQNWTFPNSWALWRDKPQNIVKNTECCPQSTTRNCGSRERKQESENPFTGPWLLSRSTCPAWKLSHSPKKQEEKEEEKKLILFSGQDDKKFLGSTCTKKTTRAQKHHRYPQSSSKIFRFPVASWRIFDYPPSSFSRVVTCAFSSLTLGLQGLCVAEIVYLVVWLRRRESFAIVHWRSCGLGGLRRGDEGYGLLCYIRDGGGGGDSPFFFLSFAQKVLKTAGGRVGERDFGRETESDF